MDPAIAAPGLARAGRRGAALLELALVGGGTIVLFPLAWLVRAAVGLDDAELAAGFLTFHAAFVINDPHFAVTYLLFYRRGLRELRDPATSLAQRARVLLAGVVAPVALCAWAGAAIALRSAELLGAMVQLMYLTVGWHYAKQGFGVLAVLCARRGVFLSARERVAFVAHALAGWAFAWANPSMPAARFVEKGVVYTAIARPRWLELSAGAALAATTIAVVVVLATGRRREGRSLPAGPVGAMLVTVWLWTIFSAIDPVMRYLVPALHSVQYLYFVWLVRRNEARAHEGPPTFGRPPAVRVAALAVSAIALGLALFHVGPSTLDALFVPRGKDPGPLGPTPFFAAIYVIVNVHHFLMDHAVWRRESPDARWLVAA